MFYSGTAEMKYPERIQDVIHMQTGVSMNARVATVFVPTPKTMQ